MSITEMLNYAWARVLSPLEGKEREKFHAAIEGRLGEHGGILVDDPDLPAELQGREAPDWWDADGTNMGNYTGNGGGN